MKIFFLLLFLLLESCASPLPSPHSTPGVAIRINPSPLPSPDLNQIIQYRKNIETNNVQLKSSFASFQQACPDQNAMLTDAACSVVIEHLELTAEAYQSSLRASKPPYCLVRFDQERLISVDLYKSGAGLWLAGINLHNSSLLNNGTKAIDEGTKHYQTSSKLYSSAQCPDQP